MLAGLVFVCRGFPPCFRFAEPFIMGRVLLLALASLTLSVDAGLPYSWYLSRGLLLRGCDAESTGPAALRSGTPCYLLVLPDVSSDAADCEATECSQEQFDQFPGCSRCATRPPEQWRSPECAASCVNERSRSTRESMSGCQ